MGTLQEQLINADLVKAKQVEIPPKWRRCEIIFPVRDAETSLLIPLENGEAGVNYRYKIEGRGRAIISPREISSKPDEYNPKLLKALQDINSAHPTCEIIWD